MKSTRHNRENQLAEVSDAITVREAGRRGGNVTRDRHGRRFYQKIGAEGGRRTRELYAELLSEFGKRGGRPKRPTPARSEGEQDRD